jgi:hypothetical protein
MVDKRKEEIEQRQTERGQAMSRTLWIVLPIVIVFLLLLLAEHFWLPQQ